MLKVFRDNLKYLSWVLWLVIVVFVVFLFTDFGAINPGGGLVETSVAARVGKHEISYADFEQAYRAQEAQLESVYGQRIDPDMARRLGLYQQVMEYLVTERILLAEADRLGVEVTDSEVRETILGYPVFLDESGNFIGEEQYQSILRNNRWTASDFEESVRKDMLTNRVRAILNQNVYVSAQEVEESYRDQAEKAKIRYVRLPGSDFADQVTFENSELDSYFAENQADFEIPERRVVDYLLIDRGALQASLEITDDEIFAYYEENKADYTREEQVQARHILVRTGADRSVDEAKAVIAEARARIERGEDFAAIAGEISDDPGSKARGGDLGTFGRGQMVGPFEEAAFGAAVGDLVGPVETNFGVHLIEVQGKTAGGVQPLDQVSAGISNRIASERALTLAETKSAEISQRIERENISDPEGLKALADSEIGVTFLTTDPFAETDSVTGVGRSTAFTVAAFDAEVGEITEAVQIPRGWAVLHLSEIQESRIPELSEVEGDVRAALAGDKQTALAEARLTDARGRLDEGKTLDDLAAELGQEVQESAEFGVADAIGDLGRNRALAEAALALDAGAVGGPVRDDQGAVLFEVVERQRFDQAAFESEKETTRTALEARRASEMLTALISARREELGVTYDPAFIENFELAGG
jgi:peptidyl-prolyl cis-trans isomerase D